VPNPSRFLRATPSSWVHRRELGSVCAQNQGCSRRANCTSVSQKIWERIHIRGGRPLQTRPSKILVRDPTHDGFRRFLHAKERPMAEILAGNGRGEGLFSSPWVGDRCRRPHRKDLKTDKQRRKTRFSDAAKKVPREVRPLMDKAGVHSEGEGWNPIYESFRVHTHKTGRNVHVKQDLPPWKHGGGGGWGGPVSHGLGRLPLKVSTKLAKGVITTTPTSILIISTMADGPFERLLVPPHIPLR